MNFKEIEEKINIKFNKIKIYDIFKKQAFCECDIHGKFKKNVYDLLKSKYGCPECGKNISKNNKKCNTEIFLSKVKEKFPNYKYDYSLVNYKNSKEKIEIICIEHGNFFITPNDFLQGKKCRLCSKLKNKDEFKNSVESKFKNISIIDNYKGIEKNIIFKCKNHGEQNIIAKQLLRKGCPKCNNEISKLTKIEKTKNKYLKIFKEKFGDNFTYIEYINSRTKMTIKCNAHNIIFKQIPYSHLKNNGCPLCSNYTIEKKCFKILNKKINFEYQKMFKDLKDKLNLSYDFYIPSKNLLIEINGEQHYKPVRFGNISLDLAKKNLKLQRHHDWLKRKYAKDNKINLLTIPYWEFRNIENILLSELEIDKQNN